MTAGEVLLLASTDMNHFSTAEVSEQLDFMAIDAMTAYDPQRLYRGCQRKSHQHVRGPADNCGDAGRL